MKFTWPWSKRRLKQAGETLLLLKQLRGQKLLDVSVDAKYREWQLHFEDFVVFVSDPFPSPIIERITWHKEP